MSRILSVSDGGVNPGPDEVPMDTLSKRPDSG